MVNPTITKKPTDYYTPSEEAKKLFQVIYRENQAKSARDSDVPKIRVSEIISKMAFYYEKIRNAVDYEEEPLLRKNAIARILKRQIVIEGSISLKGLNSLDISKHLLTELIRAGYLPNNSIPETKIHDISQIIGKYLKLKMFSAPVIKNKKEEDENKDDLLNWFLALAASEIEEILGRNKVDLAIIEYIYEILNKNIILPDDSAFKDDKEVQIYISIHRKYLKLDEEMIGFILFKYYNSQWQNPSDEEIIKIADKIFSIRRAINYQIKHPLARQIDRLVSIYNVNFTILRDVIEDNPVRVYEMVKAERAIFGRKIKEACNRRYKNAKAKLWRAAVRSIIYIFVTKSVFAILLEIPATKFLGEPLNDLALAINISFPAILLFIIVLFTRLPSESNSQKIVEGIEGVVYKELVRQEPYVLRPAIKRGKVRDSIFGFIYFLTFLLSISVVIFGLDQIGFNWVSITIFLFFLLFVSFFATRIRKNAREYIIVPPKETILNFISDFFYIPVVSAGKWLSEKFSHLNVFVFVLDFIIEAPFKIFVEIAEEWTKYVRERKDDIV